MPSRARCRCGWVSATRTTGPSNWTDPEVTGFRHLIRSPEDPDEAHRARSLGGEGRNAWGHRRKRSFSKANPSEFLEPLRAHFAAHGPCSFNCACVHIFGRTADYFAGTAVDRALWLLVEARELEHTVPDLEEDAPLFGYAVRFSVHECKGGRDGGSQ